MKKNHVFMVYSDMSVEDLIETLKNMRSFCKIWYSKKTGFVHATMRDSSPTYAEYLLKNFEFELYSVEGKRV